MLTITVSIIVLTVIVSLAGFTNNKVMNDLIFWPWEIERYPNQRYRFLTHGFLHLNGPHLFFNMVAFYSFGTSLERYLFSDVELFGSKGKLFFLLLYLSSIVIAVIPEYFARRNQSAFRSLGASGAVSAIVFAAILLQPTARMGIIFIPIHLPGYIFGILFLVVSVILERMGNTNVAHGTHIYGALYGLIFTLVTTKLFTSYETIQQFIYQIRGH